MGSWWSIPVDPTVINEPELNIQAQQWGLLCHVLLVLCAFSFVGSAFVFFSFLLFKRKWPSRLIIYFSFSIMMVDAVLLALGMTSGKVLTDPDGCKFQGTINLYFGLCAIMWWMCITAHVETYMHVICWGVSLILTIIAAAADVMSPVGVWCWVYKPAWQLGLYYIIMFFCCIVGAIMWGSIINSIVKLTQRYSVAATDSSQVSMRVIRQSLFVIWFLIIFTFMSVHRLYIYAHGYPPHILTLLHVIAMSSQGIFVFLVFGLRTEIFLFWRNFLFPRCCRSMSNSYEILD